MSHDSHPFSETFFMASLLSFFGGFIDVYTYVQRGGVFAFGQTGNLIFLGLALAEAKWAQAFFTLIPLFSFVFGVYVCELLRTRIRQYTNIHWQQWALIIEAGALCSAAFIPSQGNFWVISIFSFISAIQMSSFRKVEGLTISTNMFTGNIRSATELFFSYLHGGETSAKIKSIKIYLLVFFFCLGAISGALSSKFLGLHSPLVGGIALFCIAFLFFREDAS